jgi:UDP-N-acetyl-D-mannosaminuronic acid dehydrogenase
MPTFTTRRLVEELPVSVDQATVAVLGVTYRPGIPELRASPAIEIGRLLSELGTRVLGVDPLVEDWSELPFEPVDLDALSACSPDGIVLVTPHEAFDDLEWERFDDELAVIDGRDVLASDVIDGPNRRVRTLGVAVDARPNRRS